MRVFFRDKLAVVGVLVIVFTICALYRSLDRTVPRSGQGDSNVSERLESTELAAPAWTDAFGRDILSRLISAREIRCILCRRCRGVC